MPTSPPPMDSDEDDTRNAVSSSEDSSPMEPERHAAVPELQGVAHGVHQALIKEYSHVCILFLSGLDWIHNLYAVLFTL